MIDPDAQFFRHPSDASFEAGRSWRRAEYAGALRDAFIGGVLVGACVGVFGCLVFWLIA